MVHDERNVPVVHVKQRFIIWVWVIPDKLERNLVHSTCIRNIPVWFRLLTLCKEATIHQVTTTLATSKNVLFPGHMTQIYSGITRGRVLNGEISTQRLQKLIYLYLSTDCFMKISLQPSRIGGKSWWNMKHFMKLSNAWGLERNLHETVCRQIQIN